MPDNETQYITLQEALRWAVDPAPKGIMFAGIPYCWHTLGFTQGLAMLSDTDLARMDQSYLQPVNPATGRAVEWRHFATDAQGNPWPEPCRICCDESIETLLDELDAEEGA